MHCPVPQAAAWAPLVFNVIDEDANRGLSCWRLESEFGAGYAKRLTHWRNIVAYTCRTLTYLLDDRFAGKVDP